MAEPQFTTEELESEEWRVCADFPNYDVSNLGRVRRNTPGLPYSSTYAGRILSLVNRRGYMGVTLFRDGKRHDCRVHRLVALAFLGTCPPGREIVNHLNGTKHDNRPQNLEWVSTAENDAHATRMGLKASGDRSGPRLHPERMPRGDNHYSRTNPERLARGDRHGSRIHPERMQRGELRHTAKLSPGDIPTIRARRASGHTLPAIADDYGITRQSVWRIIHGKSWKHIP